MTLVVKTTGFDDYLDKSGGAYIKVLMLGQADVGKTRSASFWPKPIFADCEKGRMSIADRGVPYVEIKSSVDMDAFTDMLRRECAKPPEQRKYLTAVIDTLDSYQRKVIQERLRAENKVSLSGWADWGFLDAKMTNLIERLLSLPMNIIVNLHVKDENEGDDEAKTLVKKGKLKGDIKDQIANDFDLVGIMETGFRAENGKRVRTRYVRWHPDPKYPLLKDRSGRLPERTDIDFTPTDYDRVFGAIVGEFMDELPATTVVEELEVASPPGAAGPNEKGGPVATEGDIPKAKAAKKAAAKKTAAKKATAKKAEPEPEKKPEKAPAKPRIDEEIVDDSAPQEAAAPEADPEASTDVEAAEQLLAEGLGATPAEAEVEPEAEAEPDEPKPEPKPKGEVCGSQPDHLAKKYDAAKGCGKDLADTPRDRINIAVLRAKTRLCADCFETWKHTH